MVKYVCMHCMHTSTTTTTTNNNNKRQRQRQQQQLTTTTTTTTIQCCCTKHLLTTLCTNSFDFRYSVFTRATNSISRSLLRQRVRLSVPLPRDRTQTHNNATKLKGLKSAAQNSFKSKQDRKEEKRAWFDRLLRQSARKLNKERESSTESAGSLHSLTVLRAVPYTRT